MIKKNILITSAGVATATNVISALKKSKIFDCRIIAVDMSEDAVGLYLSDGFRITPPASDQFFLDTIFQIIRDEKIDFVFPLHSSETLIFSEHIKRFREYGVGIVLPDQEAVKICTNKDLFVKFLEANGLDSPATYTDQEMIETFPVFIKPKIGSSSVGARKINNKEELRFFLLGKEEQFLIQEFVDWPEITIDCYVNKNGALVGFVPRYRLKVKDGKSVVSKTMFHQQIFQEAAKLIGAMQFKGACNLQVFFRDGLIKFIELNPRLAAGGLPLSVEAGVNIPELMMLDYFDFVPDKTLDFEKDLKMYRFFTEVFVR